VSHSARKRLGTVLRTQRQVRQQLLARSPDGKTRTLMDYRWALTPTADGETVSTTKVIAKGWVDKLSGLLALPRAITKS